ncbi:MAG TPA: PH domain-containing protein [Thermoanaerobaculia bacterium]|nr:PH domain-containing protein [Thermoanaerobaculia bacterium]
MAGQLQADEEVLYQAHVSRISLIPWGLVLALFAVGAGVAQASAFTEVAIGLGIVAAVVLAVIGWKYYVLQSHEYLLTNRRVVQQTGILTRRSVDSHLEKINNVEHVQTLWGRILGYGDVLIDTASETGTTVFRQISNPLDFKRAILGAAEAYRRGRAVPVAAGVSGIPAGPSGAERMRQLKTLLDDGLISPEEFEAKRRQILAEM